MRRGSIASTNSRIVRDSKYAAKNTAKGVKTPSRMGSGGTPDGVTNPPRAPSTATIANQATTDAATRIVVSEGTVDRGSAGCERVRFAMVCLRCSHLQYASYLTRYHGNLQYASD